MNEFQKKQLRAIEDGIRNWIDQLEGLADDFESEEEEDLAESLRDVAGDLLIALARLP